MDLSNLRAEYTQGHLDEKKVALDPFLQFAAWFKAYQDTQPPEANVMSMASVGKNGMPWQRTLLLKSFSEQGFVFFSNYESEKGQQLAANPQTSLHFLWLIQERQVQIQGRVEVLSEHDSQAYFSSRPITSQLGAWASKQSQPIKDRATLEAQYQKMQDKFANKTIPKPEYWGGYLLKPSRFEFWQGGASRLHDRVEYQLDKDAWTIQRLSP